MDQDDFVILYTDDKKRKDHNSQLQKHEEEMQEEHETQGLPPTELKQALTFKRGFGAFAGGVWYCLLTLIAVLLILGMLALIIWLACLIIPAVFDSLLIIRSYLC